MPRGPNFYYQADPVASIGASLGKALFGDPEAHAAQAEADAKLDYYVAQSDQPSRACFPLP